MDKNTNVKKMKTERAKAEEATLNRILYWVVGGAVLEFLLLLLNRYWSHYTVSQIELAVALRTVVRVLAVVSLLGAVAAGFWWYTARKQDRKTGIASCLCIFLAGVSVSCFATWIFSSAGLRLMYIAVPVVIILAMVFYLYQHEFFLVAVESALTLLGIWICDSGRGALAYAYVVAALLLILAGALLCKWTKSRKGKVSLGGKKVRVFSSDANYPILYTGAVILALVLVLAAVGVAPLLLYAVAVAWLLIMAVYYTVKLM